MKKIYGCFILLLMNLCLLGCNNKSQIEDLGRGTNIEASNIDAFYESQIESDIYSEAVVQSEAFTIPEIKTESIDESELIIGEYSYLNNALIMNRDNFYHKKSDFYLYTATDDIKIFISPKELEAGYFLINGIVYKDIFKWDVLENTDEAIINRGDYDCDGVDEYMIVTNPGRGGSISEPQLHIVEMDGRVTCLEFDFHDEFSCVTAEYNKDNHTLSMLIDGIYFDEISFKETDQLRNSEINQLSYGYNYEIFQQDNKLKIRMHCNFTGKNITSFVSKDDDKNVYYFCADIIYRDGGEYLIDNVNITKEIGYRDNTSN